MQAAIRDIKQGVKWRTAWCLLFFTVFIQASHAITPLRLIASNPSNNSNDVERSDLVVSLTFSANLNSHSVAANQVVLRRANAKETVAITVMNNQISIKPARALLPATTYTLIVAGVQGDEGEALSSPVSLVFKTRDGTWHSPQRIVAGSQDAPTIQQSTQLAFNKEDGSAMVIWTEHTSTLRTDLFASRYASGQWNAPQQINGNMPGEVLDAAIAVGKAGVAVAVWEICYTNPDDGSMHFRIVSNEYTPAAGWATPQLFDVDATQGGFSPKVAISPDGRATVVWYQYVRGTGRIFSSQYTSGNGWSAAVALDAASSAPGSFNPHIAFDHNGNGYVLWEQWWHGVTLIWGNRYMSNRGWIAPQIIQSDRTAFSDEPQFAFDGNGNAMAIWPQSGEIFSSRYMRDQGWSTSLDISDGIEGVRPTIDVNASGDAFVTWTQVVVTGTDAHGIPRTRGIDWSARYTIADGWEAPILLQDPNGFDSGNVSLAVDDAGNSIAAWSEFNGSFYRIYTNRYLVASGWIGRKVIDTTNTVGASKPHVAVDATGNAVAVWEQTDAVGNTGIWSSRFE